MDVRASAIAAVDAAENSIRTKAPRIETILTAGIPVVQVPGPSAGATAPQTAVCDTELSAELCSFPDMSTNIKLVTLQAALAVTDTASALAPSVSGLHCFCVCAVLCCVVLCCIYCLRGSVDVCVNAHLPGCLRLCLCAFRGLKPCMILSICTFLRTSSNSSRYHPPPSSLPSHHRPT